MKKPFILLLITALSPTHATILELVPEKDNTLYETSSEPLSNGLGQYIFAGRTGNNNNGLIRRAVLKFDLSAVPENTVINNVTLSLIVSRRVASSTVSIHLTEADWGEGTSDAGGEEGQGAPASLNDATWISAFNGDKENGGISWSNVGGDFSENASANATVTNLGELLFTGPNLIADVENWLNETNPNYGWFIIGDEGTLNSAVRFVSKDNVIEQPKLILDVELPDLIYSNGFEQLN